MEGGGTTHRQLLKHASPSTVLPSSHCSPTSIVPLPQSAEGDEDDEEEELLKEDELLEEEQEPEEHVHIPFDWHVYPVGQTAVVLHGWQEKPPVQTPVAHNSPADFPKHESS